MKNIKPEVLKNLPPTSETGRYFVHSKILNKTFCIEPIGDHKDNLRSEWGDVNPATKKLEKSDYGDKHKGSIKMKENGFQSDGMLLGVGVSPEGYIMDLEQEFLKKQKQ